MRISWIWTEDALFDPHFKPDFNPDLLTSVNYICHLFVVKKELVDKVGGFPGRSLTEPRIMTLSSAVRRMQRRSAISRRSYTTGAVTRIPRPATRRASFTPLTAGARAIMAHYERVGIEAEKVEKGVDYGIYHTTFKIKGDPLVSVIIPNKDHTVDLDNCIRPMLDGRDVQKPGVYRGGEQQHRAGDLGLIMRRSRRNSRMYTWSAGSGSSTIPRSTTSA